MVLFYNLFNPVNRTLSLLAAFVGLIAIALQAVSAIFQMAPLTILHGGELSSAFTAEHEILDRRGNGKVISLVKLRAK